MMNAGSDYFMEKMFCVDQPCDQALQRLNLPLPTI